jgi:hypothetical protein
MAQREGAAPKRAAKKKKGAPGVSDGIKALAGKGGKGKGKVPNGSNSGEPLMMQTVGKKDEESFLQWQKRIRTQQKVLDKAMELARDERGRLGELYAGAKESGVPAHRLSVLKKLLKEEARDPTEVVADAKEMAWQAGVTHSPLKQLGLFEIAEPSAEAYQMLGEAAGKTGQPMDNAPGKPGEERHTNWISGWKKGQRELSESTFGDGGKGGAGDGPTQH